MYMHRYMNDYFIVLNARAVVVNKEATFLLDGCGCEYENERLT